MMMEEGFATELIIFDMDGVMYKFDGSGTDNAILLTPFYREIAQRGTAFIAEKLSVSKITAEMIREEVFQKYAGSVSIGLEKDYGINKVEYFAGAWDIDAARYINPDKKLRDFISNLSCKKAILTSAPHIWAKRALKQLNIYDLFDGLWFGDGDSKKPCKDAYTQILDAFGVKPEDTIMVEDEPRYLKPAKELGVGTVLIGSVKEPWIDYNIREIYELRELFGVGI